MLLSISGLAVGQEIQLPGPEITEAVKRYWKHGLFSDVTIAADSLVGDNVYLHIYLKAETVLMSAWIPAPPPLSLPAIVRTLK